MAVDRRLKRGIHYLNFNPSGPHLYSEEEREATNIPDYLFRVTTPDSLSTIDSDFIRSKDSARKLPSSVVDCFDREDKAEVANELNLHLRWSRADHADNFVSWTTSLLYALQLICKRCASRNDPNSRLDTAYLCMIKTWLYPVRTSVRDVDLIDAFKAFDLSDHDTLAEFGKKRETEYFGEYLSQGPLKKTQYHMYVLSARQLFDDGVVSLRALPFTNHPAEIELESQVLRYREVWGDGYLSKLNQQAKDAALRIMFRIPTSDWTAPIVTSFLTLVPRGHDDERVLEVLDQVWRRTRPEYVELIFHGRK